MEYVVIALMLALIVALWAWGRFHHEAPPTVVEDAPGPAMRTCPLCGSSLTRGQTLRTRLVTLDRPGAPGLRESLAEVLGCPHCWPARDSRPRQCPSCHGTLEASWTVAARYFERPDAPPGEVRKRNHLRILGCPRCRGRS